MIGIDALKLLHFEIVSGCQLSCVGCPSPIVNSKIEWIDPLDFHQCFSNLDVKAINILRLFNYGEPLLHPQLTQIGEVLLKNKHINFNRIEISTNAQHCNWDDFEGLIRLGVITDIAVSCDGDGTPESYTSLRPPAKWNKLLEFFEKCSTLVKNAASSVNLITRTIITSHSDIQRWNAVLAPYGFKPEFRGWKQLPQSRKNMTNRQTCPGRGICQFVERADSFFINAHGEVVPCCAHPKAGFFGNIKGSKLSQIANGPQRQQFIRRLLTDRETMEICGRCEFGPRDNPGPSAGQILPST
jgi:radical SAM protein with 4Fe4S-binding SPASM domain